MRLKKIFLIAALSLPMVAQADVNINNNTDEYGTGYISYSPCSSSAGERGIMKPHQSLVLTKTVIGFFCGASSCRGQVFLSKNCTGKKLAMITLSAKDGVTKVENLDPEHFTISGGGENVTVEPAASGWTKWVKNLLG